MTRWIPLVWLVACHHVSPDPAATSTVDTTWLAEADATALLARLASGDLTADAMRRATLDRIAALDRSGAELRSLIRVDPGAEAGPGRLGGLPIALKDNIDAAGLPTTAGSLALATHVPSDDAFLVARLRAEGGLILAKANLSEWANMRGKRSISGWSAVGGFTRNPHVLDRNPCGSSSGSAVAVAAGLVAFAVGTETDGSILCPASVNGIVGVKPTLGLVSRDGIVPIAHSQDTAGPMTRSVADAALLLEVLAAADPNDPAAADRPSDLDTAYVAALKADALSGAVIGVARGLEPIADPTLRVFDAAVADLRRLGATVVELDLALPSEVYEHEEVVLYTEYPVDLAAYLASVDPALGLRGIPELIAFDLAHADEELRWFGQEEFEVALAADPAGHDAALEAGRRLTRELIDGALATHHLDAIVTPTCGPAWPIDPVLGDRPGGCVSTATAVSGYPAVTVPMGDVHGLPVGMNFLGTAWSEARLLALAYAYEQAAPHRKVPPLRPSLVP